MPLSSVYSISPVFATVSSVPSVSGAGAAATAAAASAGGSAGGLADTLVFRPVVWSYDARGAPVPTYPLSAATTGSVARQGAPTLASTAREGAGAELRPEVQVSFEITTAEDPGGLLGAPLKTHDHVEWAGFTLGVIGTAIPQGTGWLTKAVLTL